MTLSLDNTMTYRKSNIRNLYKEFYLENNNLRYSGFRFNSKRYKFYKKLLK